MAILALLLALTTATTALGPELPESTRAHPAAYTTARQDSIRFSANLSTTTIGVGETAVLELYLESRGSRAGHITIPVLPPELEVVSTSDFTQLQFTIPGGRTRTIRREVVIHANAPGTFRIPPATARVRDTEYRTPELTLTVVDAVSRGAPGAPGASSATPIPNPGANARGPRDEVLIHAHLVPDTIYVGQQVTLVARTWIDEETQLWLRRAPEYHAPSAPGLWTHDLHSATRNSREFLHDRAYRVQEFQRAFFPLSPGVYTLPPARLGYQIRRSFRFDAEERNLATDSLRFVVLPLPLEGRPADFNGAVGSLSITARLEPASVPAGEATSLIVELEGIGNVKSLPPPKLPAMDGVELFPPAEDARIEVDHGTVGGTKRFTWIMIPRTSGRLEVPAIEYDFFDPMLHRYRTASTDPLTLVAIGADGEPVNSTPTHDTGDVGLDSVEESRPFWLRTPILALALAAPLLMLLPMLTLRRRRRGRLRQDQAPRAQREQLHAALRQLRRDDAMTSDEALRNLAAIIRAAIALQIGTEPPARGTPQNLAPALEESGVPSATANALADLLARVEAVRYRPAPPTTAEQHSLLKEAEHLLAILDRHARTSRKRRPARLP